MEESHFQAERLESNNGYTWTLVTRLGDMLQEATSLYGRETCLGQFLV